MGKKTCGIEPGIAVLVATMNKVPYLNVCSSCEGHFNLGDTYNYRPFAEVIFDIYDGYEKKMEGLVNKVLGDLAPDFGDTLVKMAKEYYVVPDDLCLLNHNYRFQIIPVDIIAGEDHCRKVVDIAIGKATHSVEDYLNTYQGRFQSADTL